MIRVPKLARKITSESKLWLLWMVTALILAFNVATAQNTQQAGVVKTTRLVLVDEKGQERAFLGFDGNNLGLYFFARGREKSDEPVISLSCSPIEIRSDKPIANTKLLMRNGLTPTEAYMNPNAVGLRHTEKKQAIELAFLNWPQLLFEDHSGFPYVKLDYNDVDGVRFQLRNPLGIEDAYEKAVQAHIKGEKGDPRVDDALHRSLRLDCRVPPFAEPTLSLWKDGSSIWQAK